MLLFAFLPYFPKQNFDETISRVHLFNLSLFGEQYISDADLRKRIDKYSSLYVDANNNRSTTFTIAVIDDNYRFELLTEKQQLDLSRYAVALLFCNVVNNTQNRVCVSEQFTLSFQPFTVIQNGSSEADYIWYETGSYYRVLNSYPLDSARFVTPGFIPPYNLFYLADDKLMLGLANMIDNSQGEDDKYFRVLDWVRYSHLNSEGFSPESRIVMLATAFEIFFELPRDDKTNKFVQSLESLLQVDKMLVEDDAGKLVQTGLPLITKPYTGHAGKTKSASHTIYGWWAREFYDLRSKIVHGDEITNTDIRNHKGEQHFLVALKVLRFCFYKLLENKGYLTYKFLTDVPTLENYSWEQHSTLESLREVEQMIS
jgi:hypothetical protein